MWTYMGSATTGGFGFGNLFIHQPVEDPRIVELRRRVIDRVNSNPRFVQYILDTQHGVPDGEPFFQACLAKARELEDEIDRRLAERENAGRFVQAPGQVEVEQSGYEKPPPTATVPEEVSELMFLPWILWNESRKKKEGARDKS